mmetsp:Transcript_93335/g.165137  ORF Transcript_93335/g.165137 Transcript_93335/m.165137 type:complete len:369 (+) Transcript_93335:424-1530(+)
MSLGIVGTCPEDGTSGGVCSPDCGTGVASPLDRATSSKSAGVYGTSKGVSSPAGAVGGGMAGVMSPMAGVMSPGRGVVSPIPGVMSPAKLLAVMSPGIAGVFSPGAGCMPGVTSPCVGGGMAGVPSPAGGCSGMNGVMSPPGGIAGVSSPGPGGIAGVISPGAGGCPGVTSPGMCGVIVSNFDLCSISWTKPSSVSLTFGACISGIASAAALSSSAAGRLVTSRGLRRFCFFHARKSGTPPLSSTFFFCFFCPQPASGTFFQLSGTVDSLVGGGSISPVPFILRGVCLKRRLIRSVMFACCPPGPAGVPAAGTPPRPAGVRGLALKRPGVALPPWKPRPAGVAGARPAGVRGPGLFTGVISPPALRRP